MQDSSSEVAVAEGLSLTITAQKLPQNQKSAALDSYRMCVSAKPPTGTGRAPTDIVCVVDISGSMDSAADCQDENGNVESSGLSLLDVTKHAIRTVVSTLSESDRLGIVSYSDSGRKELSLTKMNDVGKTKANSKTESLQTEGCTNLWDGLLKALELFRDAPPNTFSRNMTIFLLTDGQPNREPPKGHVPSLRTFLDKHPELSAVSINTFAFGYGAKSDLLEDIAREGSGTFTFVPDAGFVGTGFVNALANVLSTCAVSARLSLEVEEGVKVKSLSKSHSLEVESWGGAMNIGSIQLGQSKDLVLEVTAPPSAANLLAASLSFEMVGTSGGKQRVSAKISAGQEEDTAKIAEILYHSARANFLDAMSTALEYQIQGDNDDAMKEIKAFIKKNNTTLKESSAFANGSNKEAAVKISDLVKDAAGQVAEAFSREEYFRKWGRHYIPSLRQAHETQRCNNFKDPGIQSYGGSIFAKVRDFADDQFNKLPPPKASRLCGSTPAASYRPVNMARYNNCHGGCVSGCARVLMGDGRSILNAENIRKGDIVSTAGGGAATVRCVIKTNSDASGKMPLVELGGLLITPWHPIRKSGAGRWVFPADLGLVVRRDCPSVYTFVLTAGHEMLINGFHYSTLGHGKMQEVVRHSFWGNMHAVVDSLEACKGWSRGFVEFSVNNVMRENGIVVGFDPKTEVLNEKKTPGSILRGQVQFWKKEMSKSDGVEIHSEAKSKPARAKIVRNNQRPRVTRRGAWKSLARDLQDEIAFGKEICVQ